MAAGAAPLRRAVGLGVVTALALTACSMGGDAGPDGDVDGPRPTGTLRAAMSGRVETYDPHRAATASSTAVLDNVYDTLVVPAGDDLSYQPSLAERWETSADGLTWTFTLRGGVTFHDGTNLDAADVVYSYQRIVDGRLAGAPGLATVESVVGQGERTVVIGLSRPTPNLLDSLGASVDVAILPVGAARRYDLDTQAVGTGPFRLADAGPRRARLTAFTDHWDDGPFLAEVDVQLLARPAAALAALRDGRVQWVGSVPAQQIAALSEEGNVELGQAPSVDYWSLVMNLRRPPFDELDVRRAVAVGLDRAGVAAAVGEGTVTPNQTAIPPDSYWHYDYAPFDHDVEAASLLLADVGLPAPLDMGLMVASGNAGARRAAQAVAAQLAVMGVRVTLEAIPRATWRERRDHGDFDAMLLGRRGNIDPVGYYDAEHSCEGAANYQGYCDQVTTQLLEEAAGEPDLDRRKDLYDAATKRIVDDVSHLFLYNTDVVQAWSPRLENYVVRPDRAVDFSTARLRR